MTNDKILLTVDQISQKLDAVCQDGNDTKVQIARIIEQNVNQTKSIGEMKLAVDKLVQIVYTGNGQPSLVSRVATVETKQGNIVKSVDKIEDLTDIIAIESKKTSKKYNLILIGMTVGLVLFLYDAASGTEFVKLMISIVKG